MKTIHLLAFLLSTTTLVQAQLTSVSKNLVPNPGFEEFSAPPLGWYYKGEHYTRLVKYWSSPTGASPDAFGPRVLVPNQWKNKGFGAIKPQEGKAMTGITVYGCEDGKPHCREYIQVKLDQALQIGNTYQLSFWVAHLNKSLFIDQLDVALNDVKIEEKEDKLLNIPTLGINYKLDNQTNEAWSFITHTFVAEEEMQFLIMGNFKEDEATAIRSDCDDHFGYAYYYIDAVQVRKVSNSESIDNIPIEEGEVILLENIYFETDKHRLLPKSKDILRNLLSIFDKHPNLKVEIVGHTDDVGSPEYNVDLSKRRAKAVMEFLIENDIEAGNLSYDGFGDKKPIALNSTKNGRQKNRRVEFRIIQK